MVAPRLAASIAWDTLKRKGSKPASWVSKARKMFLVSKGSSASPVPIELPVIHPNCIGIFNKLFRILEPLIINRDK